MRAKQKYVWKQRVKDSKGAMQIENVDVDIYDVQNQAGVSLGDILDDNAKRIDKLEKKLVKEKKRFDDFLNRFGGLKK